MNKLEYVTREVRNLVTQNCADNRMEHVFPSETLREIMFNTTSGRHEIECFFGVDFEQEQVDAWETVQNIIDDVMNLWALPISTAVERAAKAGDSGLELINTDRAQVAAMGKTLNDYATESHADNIQWWLDRDGNKLDRNKGELLCLIHSEVSEAMEGERKNLMDDKLPHRHMAEVELADTLIRIFDYAGAFGYDLEGAYQEKRAYNKQRADHKREARDQVNGKKW